ncbi:tetratricopeptide repeat protein [Streptomyces sp. AM 2-1-1]|uniref:tetratricopeptide repeat protein n=1 Tax=Streptomyces sp. AM 2-1-1 TaxID=3028709 RepID=UPI0023B8E962|nr:tetratricopeptide repeat protein [Streptomyces sp. AM 2-1-1]WEH43861.1 tetratricopeptide repeat protein [Streptomyces sp. AM 2-1-1]
MRQELMSLPKTLAEDVARNLVMVARLIDEDPEEAYGYSRVALRLASRVAAVREAAGFAAYATQKYGEALAEFRAAKRMTGSVELWPVMADCERGLGRPERAMAMAGEPEVQKLDKAGQVEMRLVAAGARRDMGQIDAAIVTLQSPELASHAIHPWTPRLRYAYADALLEAGREDEAREWFGKALESDKDGSTDASDRLAELDGVEFVDALDEDEERAAGTAAAVTSEAPAATTADESDEDVADNDLADNDVSDDDTGADGDEYDDEEDDDDTDELNAWADRADAAAESVEAAPEAAPATEAGTEESTESTESTEGPGTDGPAKA